MNSRLATGSRAVAYSGPVEAKQAGAFAFLGKMA